MATAVTLSLKAAISEVLDEGVSLDDVPEIVLARWGPEIVLPHIRTFIYRQATAINRSRRSAVMSGLVEIAVGSPDELPAARERVAASLWARQWPVIRDGLYEWIRTDELTVDDLLLLAGTYRRRAERFERYARCFEELCDLVRAAGVSRLGDLPADAVVRRLAGVESDE